MSCEACDLKNEGQEGIAYYRWKNANIAVMGCDVHLREVFDALNGVQAERRKMQNFYITFGQIHTHSHNGKTLDKDCVGVIRATSEDEGRKLAFEWFGKKWSMFYTEAKVDEKFLSFFPRGLIKLN